MVKLKQLEYFRAVMLYGSINRAAHYLCVSQPVASRVIAHLENSIGLELFERRASHLIPTKNAYILNRYCDDIFEKTNRLNSVIKSLQSKRVDHLKFCASPALCNSFLPKIVARYDGSACVHFESSMIRDIASNVESGMFEFGLSIWPILSDKIECIPVAESNFVFLCHESNPLSSKNRIRFEDFVDEEFIFTNRSNPIGEYIERKLQEMDVTFERYLEVDRSEIVCAIINAGRGVSILNGHGFDASQWQNVRSVPLDQPIHTNIYLILPKFGTPSNPAVQFIDFFKQECQP